MGRNRMESTSGKKQLHKGRLEIKEIDEDLEKNILE